MEVSTLTEWTRIYSPLENQSLEKQLQVKY